MPTSQHLVNPFKSETETEHVQSEIPRPLYDFFFRQLLPGERGVQRAMINKFFLEFKAALDAEGLKAWEIGIDKKVADILNRINFKSTKRKAKSVSNV